MTRTELIGFQHMEGGLALLVVAYGNLAHIPW